jgi:ABC-type bacteriocin/lantibiotic exporter with double-glycine peptidase domain
MDKVFSLREFVGSQKYNSELLPVKIFTQSDDSLCGPASIKMVLGFYGHDVEESEIAKLCNHTYELGTDDVHMKQACESLGYQVHLQNLSTFDDINHWLKQGIPVIVDWFAGVRLDDSEVSEDFIYKTELSTDIGVPNGHSSVVVGLDDGFIYLIDPEIADYRKIRREDFMRVWFDFRNPYIMNWEEMILRQIFVILPNK